MKVTVRLFASLKEQAGTDRLDFDLPTGAKVAQLISLLSERHAVLREVLQKRTVLIALNQAVAKNDDRLKEGDEIGLLPPFSGGCNG